MDVQTSTELIIQFSKGLKWRVLGHFVQDGSPTTYSNALTRCLQKKATCTMMDSSRGHQEEPMEIGAICKAPDTGDEYLPAKKSSRLKISTLEEGIIAAFGKNAAQKTSRYPMAAAKPKARKTQQTPPVS